MTSPLPPHMHLELCTVLPPCSRPTYRKSASARMCPQTLTAAASPVGEHQCQRKAQGGSQFAQVFSANLFHESIRLAWVAASMCVSCRGPSACSHCPARKPTFCSH